MTNEELVSWAEMVVVSSPAPPGPELVERLNTLAFIIRTLEIDNRRLKAEAVKSEILIDYLREHWSP